MNQKIATVENILKQKLLTFQNILILEISRMIKKGCSFASRLLRASKKAKTLEKKEMKEQVKECRVCLQDSSDQSSSHIFIHPCLCSGSIKYVHEQCLSEWISYAVGKKKEKDERQKAIQEGVPCSMCKFPIKFSHSEQVECRNWENLREHIKTQIQMFILVTVISLFSVIGIISISYVLQQLIMKYIRSQINLVLPMVAALGIILFFSFLGISIFMFFKKLVIYKKNIITNIKNYQQEIEIPALENKIEELAQLPSDELSHQSLAIKQ